MVEASTIPLLNAQQLGMANLIHGALIMPELAQASTRDLALRLLRQEAQQVNKPTPDSSADLVAEENGGGSQGGGPPFRRKNEERPDDSAQDGPSCSENPLVGNLLNLKV